MGPRYSIKPENPEATEQIARELGVSRLTAKVLVSRGFTEAKAARDFLTPSLNSLPDPDSIFGMAAAAEFISDAVIRGEPIWIYTDFDADGVTSGALLHEFFALSGVEARVKLPRRDLHGYGLHPDILKQIAEEGGGLVITADCGITAFDAAQTALELGLKLIITDHHTPAEHLPNALAVVNPKISGTTYDDNMLAGVGVAWNLTASVRRRLRDKGWFTNRKEPDIKELLDFAAIGTVADVVPLTKVNRIIVSYGLKYMNTSRRAGISALSDVAGIKGELKAGHLGMQIGPRINAAGRMSDPKVALLALISDNNKKAKELAEILDSTNRERREEEARLIVDAIRKVDMGGFFPGSWSLVIAGEDYHPGVVGIVASRLVERYFRPTIVIAIEGDTAKGSARSIPSLDLNSALADCADLLIRFGGHKSAAGVTLKTENIPAFREAFEAAVRRRINTEDLTSSIEVDAVAEHTDITFDNACELSRLEPFGFGNPSPNFLIRGARVRAKKNFGENAEHVRLNMDVGYNDIESTGWGMGGSLNRISIGDTVDVVGSLKERHWNGYRSVTLALKSICKV